MNKRASARSLAVLGATPLLFLAVACTRTVQIAEPVGPDPSPVAIGGGPRENLATYQGCLVVHTEIVDTNADIPQFLSREPYTIFDSGGRRIMVVDDIGSRPRVVTLQSGDYVVRGKGLGGQLVDVRARVLPGKVTKIFLDQSWAPPDTVSEKGIVRSPDGSFVGWRADLSEQQ